MFEFKDRSCCFVFEVPNVDLWFVQEVDFCHGILMGAVMENANLRNAKFRYLPKGNGEERVGYIPWELTCCLGNVGRPTGRLVTLKRQ